MLSKWPGYSFVIQARLGSSRLPGKILLSFGKSTVLGTLVESLLACGAPKENVVVATTNNPLDDLTEEYSHALGVAVVRGDETDVLQRYQAVARETRATHIVRLTADNPLPDVALISHCIQRHETERPDLTSTRFIDASGQVKRYVPKGSSIDILKKSSLLAIDSENCSAFEKEHVIPYFYGRHSVSLVTDYATDRPELSIDTVEDYVRVSLYLRENAQSAAALQCSHNGAQNAHSAGGAAGEPL